MELKIVHRDTSVISIKRYSYSLKDMGKIGSELEQVKSLIIQHKSELDTLNMPDKEATLSAFNHFKNFRTENLDRLLPRKNRRMVNNSWLKGLELLARFKIFERYDTIIAHDTAAIPGFYLFAMVFYARHINKQISWTGSFQEDSKNQIDEFGLLKRHARNFTASKLFMSPSVQDQICYSNSTKGVNFIMSDYAIDTSSNYNDQEKFFTPYVVAQLIIVLRSLSKGGSAIIKQYAAYEPFTLSYIYVISSMFEESYLCKPLTSKKQNSEMFIVGIGYKYLGDRCKHNEDRCCAENNCAFMHSVIDVLQNSIQTNDYRPFVDVSLIVDFVAQFKSFFFDLGVDQISTLDQMIDIIRTIVSNKIDYHKEIQEQFRKYMHETTKEQCKKYIELFDRNPFQGVKLEKFI